MQKTVDRQGVKRIAERMPNQLTIRIEKERTNAIDA